MAAAVPFVGSIIAGIVVSKVVTAIGPKLGLSDSMTGIAATVAGVYAGGMTYNAAAGASASGISPGAGDANQVGMDLSMPTQGADLSLAGSNAAPSGAGVEAGAMDLSIGGTSPGSAAPSAVTAPPSQITPETDSALKISSAPQAQADPLSIASPVATPTETPAVAKTTIDTGTTGKPPQEQSADQSWYSKLFSSDKTLDMIMAGVQGYGDAYQAKEDREYPQSIVDKNASGWRDADPGKGGFLSMSNQPPSSRR